LLGFCTFIITEEDRDHLLEKKDLE
jgi:hypothetical protein